jgi:arylsulfatase A-like enzyme
MAASDKKPDILFIMSDDIGRFNISCNNNGIIGYRIPNIDRRQASFSVDQIVEALIPRA